MFYMLYSVSIESHDNSGVSLSVWLSVGVPASTPLARPQFPVGRFAFWANKCEFWAAPHDPQSYNSNNNNNENKAVDRRHWCNESDSPWQMHIDKGGGLVLHQAAEESRRVLAWG